METKRSILRRLLALVMLPAVILGLGSCAGRCGEGTPAVPSGTPTDKQHSVPDCASLALPDDTLSANMAATDAPLESLLAERPDIRDVAVSFTLRPAGADTMSVGEPVEFILGVSNGMDRAVVLYLPRTVISLGSTIGTLRLTLLDGHGFPVRCGWMTEIPDSAFEPQNFIELPPQSQCEWRWSLSAEYSDCWPIKGGLPLPPDQYTVWYEYENVGVGPAIPFSENPTIEPLYYDVHALLGVKRSNRVDFTIVESQGE